MHCHKSTDRRLDHDVHIAGSEPVNPFEVTSNNLPRDTAPRPIQARVAQKHKATNDDCSESCVNRARQGLESTPLRGKCASEIVQAEPKRSANNTGPMRTSPDCRQTSRLSTARWKQTTSIFTYCKAVRALSVDGKLEFSQLPDAEKDLKKGKQEESVTHRAHDAASAHAQRRRTYVMAAMEDMLSGSEDDNPFRSIDRYCKLVSAPMPLGMLPTRALTETSSHLRKQ